LVFVFSKKWPLVLELEKAESIKQGGLNEDRNRSVQINFYFGPEKVKLRELQLQSEQNGCQFIETAWKFKLSLNVLIFKQIFNKGKKIRQNRQLFLYKTVNHVYGSAAKV
jgi:hypothetical protein